MQKINFKQLHQFIAQYGTYSGCKRTVCNWENGNTICNGWAPNGTVAGDWRLPTYNELVGWAINAKTLINNTSASGLQFCDYNYSTYANRCYGLFSSGMPSDLWSSTAYQASVSMRSCSTCKHFSFTYNNGGFGEYSYDDTSNLSIRYVSSNVTRTN